MKRLISLVLFVTVIVSVVQYRKNNDFRSAVSGFSESQLDYADTLHYRIYLYGILPVGEAVVSTTELAAFKGKPVYQLSARAESAKNLSWLYVASLRADSYVDRESLLPEAFIQKLSIKGKGDSERGVVYAQDDKTMSVEGETRVIAGETYDPLSATFKIRNMSFEELKNFELNINTNQKNYLLSGSAQRSDELISRKARRIITLKADVERKEDSPYHKSHLEMVLTGEKRNTPVLVKVFASGFLMVARLVDTSNSLSVHPQLSPGPPGRVTPRS